MYGDQFHTTDSLHLKKFSSEYFKYHFQALRKRENLMENIQKHVKNYLNSKVQSYKFSMKNQR